MKKLFAILALVSGLTWAQAVVYNTDTVTVKNPDGSTTTQVWMLTYTNGRLTARTLDRKSTRLNSSHSQQSRMPSSA